VRRQGLLRDRTRLACRDFGGDGPAVLLLHGLAGHADEWAQTASWLTRRCRVVAFDARGHGHSERLPADVSRDALAADAACVIERLGLRPAVVVGQSLGGLTALSLAARRPELVRGLVLVEASPDGGGAGVEETVAGLGDALRSWPVPFASRAAAQAFFAARFGGRLAGEAWASGLESRDGGWWPRFDAGVMTRMLREAIAQPSWEEWERVSCPALVVTAGSGESMRRPGVRVVEVPGAAHDIHLDRPAEWREALSGFLDSLDGAGS
jgi:pimeloyl-ACP methyl ester carboxylesterase